VFVVLLLTLGIFFGLRAIEPKYTVAKGLKSERFAARINLSPLGNVLAAVTILPILFLALAPNLGVLLLSISSEWFMTPWPGALTLSAYSELPYHPLTGLGFRNSLIYSIGSTLIDLVVGVSIAWLIVRGRRWSKFWDGMTVLPLATPGLVLAFAYLGVFSSGVFAGSILDPRRDPTLLLMIGYAIRRLPFMVRAVEAGLRRANIELEHAARSLGVSPRRILARVTLPLLAPQLLAGSILCFTFAMLEVSEGLILAGREQDFPITKVIYALLTRPDGAIVASALGVCAMLGLAASIYAASRLTRRAERT
jgi:iron(III) transport system permease protein